MKINYENGRMSATAETLEDMKVLLALQKPVRAAYKRGGNRWKGKHKIACPTCGKAFKNLKRHEAVHRNETVPINRIP